VFNPFSEIAENDATDVDLVELATSRLVWRSRVSEALSAGYSEDNWKKLESALEQAFEKLPTRR
jgi:hypothetical protein